jgi:2-iminobutanoate/2-iminopropanoate deaminase
MSRTIISTPAAPKAPPSYSQAVKTAGLVFVSGTAPVDPETGQFVEGPVQAQVAQCLRNISAILEAAGSSLQQVVSATLIVADEDDFAAVNEEWMKWFPTDPPARQGAKMPVRVPGLKISIAMIAEAS